MKKKLLTLAILFFVFQSKAQSWAYLGYPAFSDSISGYTQMAIDQNNTPYIAFEDFLNPSQPRISVMKYTGSNWVYVGSPRFGVDPHSSGLDLTIDKNGTPYVAFSDENNADRASVMKFDGNNWVYIGTSGFTIFDADYITLAIDSNLTPYVAFEDGNQNTEVSVMKYSGTAWVYVGAAGIANQGQSNSTSIVIGPNNTPYVTFRDYVNNNQEVRVLKFNGSSWIDVGTAFNPTGIEVDIVIDKNTGTPFVVFEDAQNSGKISVKKYSANTWSYVGTAGFSQSTVYDLSIVLDASGNPIVCFRDWGAWQGPKASVMKFNGSTWAYVGQQGFSLDDTYDLEMAIDNNGTLYAGFVDLAYNWKTSVMTFGTGTGLENEELSKLSLFPNPANEYIYFDLATNEVIKSISLTNLLSEKINLDLNYNSINTTHLPNGIYSISILTQSNKIYSEKIIIAH